MEGGEEEPAVEEPMEEEFDLADVLGEEVGSSGSKEELLRKAEQELEVSITIPGRSCPQRHAKAVRAHCSTS